MGEPWVPPCSCGYRSPRGSRHPQRAEGARGERAGRRVRLRAGGARLRADPPHLAVARHAQEALGADRRRRPDPLEVQGRVRRDLQAQALHRGRFRLRLGRGVRAHLGLAVRARLRPAPVRARAGARGRREEAGATRFRARLHPVHGSADPHEGDAAERLDGGADRARRADPRLARRGRLLGGGCRNGLGPADGARLRRLLPQPLQPHPRAAARRRARDRRGSPRFLGARRGCPRRGRRVVAEPGDPDHRRAARRLRALRPGEGRGGRTAARPGATATTRSSPGSAWRWAPCTSACPPSSCSPWRPRTFRRTACDHRRRPDPRALRSGPRQARGDDRGGVPRRVSWPSSRSARRA